MKTQTAVIGWQSKITGHCGHGQPIDRQDAERLIERKLSKEWPEIEHFLIPKAGAK